MQNGAKIEVNIPFSRSTGGTHLFQLPRGEKAMVQNVYVSKDAFERPTPPKAVKVTVEYVYED